MIEEAGIRRLEEVVVSCCPLCGLEGVPLYSGLADHYGNAPGKWGYLRCADCDLVWLDPLPSIEDLSEFYAKYYPRFTADEGASNLNFRKSIKEAILAGSFGYGDQENYCKKKKMGWLFGLFSPLRNRVGRTIMFIDGHRRGRLLDVGCGIGTYLSLMRQLGWDVAGVEPSTEAAAVAREKSNLQVFVGTLEEAMFQNDTFDVITMHHVLEHLRDPLGTLSECLRILRPGGQIVVITPNIKSLGHTIFKKCWVEIAPPWHTYLWSPRILRSCVDKIGFTSVGCNTMIPFEKWMESWIIRKLQRYDWLEFQRIFARWRLLVNLIAILGSRTKTLGDEIVMSAKKEN